MVITKDFSKRKACRNLIQEEKVVITKKHIIQLNVKKKANEDWKI